MRCMGGVCIALFVTWVYSCTLIVLFKRITSGRLCCRGVGWNNLLVYLRPVWMYFEWLNSNQDLIPLVLDLMLLLLVVAVAVAWPWAILRSTLCCWPTGEWYKNASFCIIATSSTIQKSKRLYSWPTGRWYQKKLCFLYHYPCGPCVCWQAKDWYKKTFFVSLPPRQLLKN